MDAASDVRCTRGPLRGLALFLTCACLLAATLTAPAAPAADSKSMGPIVAKVLVTKGAPGATGSDGKERPLRQLSPVFLNDRIASPANSRVRLQLAEETTLALGADSLLAIIKYVFSPAAPAANGLTAKIDQGILWVKAGKLADGKPERILLQMADAATADIPGGEAAVRITPQYVFVYIIELPEGGVATVRIVAGKPVGGHPPRLLRRRHMLLRIHRMTGEATESDMTDADLATIQSDALEAPQTAPPNPVPPVAEEGPNRLPPPDQVLGLADIIMGTFTFVPLLTESTPIEFAFELADGEVFWMTMAPLYAGVTMVDLSQASGGPIGVGPEVVVEVPTPVTPPSGGGGGGEVSPAGGP